MCRNVGQKPGWVLRGSRAEKHGLTSHGFPDIRLMGTVPTVHWDGCVHSL